MRRAALLLSVLAVAVAVAGCGGGGDSEQEAPPASQAPASTEAPSATGQSAVVDIQDFTFKPGSVTVPTGGQVTWKNMDASNHNVEFDGSAPEGIANLREGQDASVKFTEAGTYRYVCTYHPGMKGAVVVR